MLDMNNLDQQLNRKDAIESVIYDRNKSLATVYDLNWTFRAARELK